MTPLFFALIQDASAPAQQQGGMNSVFQSLFPLLLCVPVFWFIVIRPEQKARKARKAMLAAIKKGDKVMTTGGLYGQVVQVQDDVMTLQVADGVRMRFARSAIQTVEADASDKAVEAKTNNA
ncbi:MAG: preprotein translocase subunit YajC [Planctomycetota bacterium]|nr:preprotein translocase subunit YajC [Planctomycetota bacterium]